MSFDDLYMESVGYWLERQYHLIDVLGDDATFVCEERAGRIRFGGTTRGDIVMRAQVLATVAGGEWLWAWANEKAALPPEVVAASQRIRALGAARGIPTLDLAWLGVDEFWTEGKYTAIACGLLEGQATFRWCWGEGTIVFLIEDPDFPADERPVRDRVYSTVRELHEASFNWGVDFDHAVRGYLARTKLDVLENGDGSLHVSFPGGQVLDIRYDAQTEQLRIGL